MSSFHHPPAERTVFRTVEDFRAFWPRTAMEAHHIELREISEDRAVLTMPVTDATRQPMGLLHGGMTMMLVETAASVHACWGVDLSKRVPVGIEIGGSHVRACHGGHVRAVATVVRRTSSMIVHTVDVFDDQSGELISTGRVTNYYKHLVAG